MGNHSESPLARKIRLLVAKANDKSVTEAEAALYAAKVQELLVANGLSMADIKEPDVERADIGGEKHNEKKQKWTSPSRRALLRTVCRFYMCEAVSPGRAGGDWTIIGRPHNVAVAITMTEYLVKTTVRLSNQWGRENPGVNVIDFRKGCMIRLQERLDDMRREQQDKKPEWKGENPGNLPALFVSESRLVKNFMRSNMNIKYVKDRDIRGGAHGFAAGRAAGDNISLHKQVGGGSGRLAIGKG